MSVCAYYNEIDPFCVQWLYALMEADLIPGGVVDDRPIQEVTPADVEGFDQVHLFAGIGGWAYALRLAGWPEHIPVWTGSCPCQPFSVAGRRKGSDDDRHLWPYMHGLIGLSEPAIVFGEQVESKAGREWLAGVQLDLEALGFAFGAEDLCAACVGAPHRRQRLYWVAESEHAERGSEQQIDNYAYRWNGSGGGSGIADRLGQPVEPRLERHAGNGDGSSEPGRFAQVADGSVAETGGTGAGPGSGSDRLVLSQQGQQARVPGQPRVAGSAVAPMDHAAEPRLHATRQHVGGPPLCAARSVESGWSDFSVVPCLDAKSRRVESGLQPLAHGVPARMGRLRGYGNAIVPQVAAAFVRAYLETKNEGCVLK
jgi:DNA (cytosine-5)-methyltransferase 1